MIERYRGWVSRLLRVPEEPRPPAGDPESFLSFRSGPNYLSYKRVVWGLGQIAALLGLLAGFLIPPLFGWNPSAGGFWWWTTGAAVLFLPQVVISYAVLRLDYDMRWYILTDRALRIRQGIFVVQEQTLTFANIQEIEVKRNPIQRLLGLSDVEVRTAGGGKGPPGAEKSGYESHRGVLRGVADGSRIRDTIRDRVRRYRSAGLGDPDDPVPLDEVPDDGLRNGGVSGQRVARARNHPEAVAAARSLAREIRLLREDLARVGSGRS